MRADHIRPMIQQPARQGQYAEFMQCAAAVSQAHQRTGVELLVASPLHMTAIA
jgi:hypothetical protein